MSKIFNSRSRRIRRCAIAVVMAGALVAVAAENPVKVPKDTDVFADKNQLSDTVETVPTGASLQPVGHEGGWVKVRTPSGKEGYVSEDDLAPIASLTGATGNTSVNGLTVTAASKGLQDDTEKYAQMKHFKTDNLNQMIIWGNDVSPKDVKDFAKSGKVGPAKYRNK
jgi:hypothetical protein